MPTRAYTQTELSPNREWLVTWTGLLNGDDGAPFERPGFADRSVEVLGTFGAGGTCLIEGSIGGTAYYTLTDVANAALSRTASGLRQVTENTRLIRPRVSAGDGTTSLTVHLLVRSDGND
jgi:hypothetical protein